MFLRLEGPFLEQVEIWHTVDLYCLLFLGPVSYDFFQVRVLPILKPIHSFFKFHDSFLDDWLQLLA